MNKFLSCVKPETQVFFLKLRDPSDEYIWFCIFLADVFRHFEKDGEFFCYPGQSTQPITGMYNLNRACQLLFPGEKILEDAKRFSFKFLREKQASNELLDKWIIAKDLPGEVWL